MFTLKPARKVVVVNQSARLSEEFLKDMADGKNDPVTRDTAWTILMTLCDTTGASIAFKAFRAAVKHKVGHSTTTMMANILATPAPVVTAQLQKDEAEKIHDIETDLDLSKSAIVEKVAKVKVNYADAREWVTWFSSARGDFAALVTYIKKYCNVRSSYVGTKKNHAMTSIRTCDEALSELAGQRIGNRHHVKAITMGLSDTL
jgi:hypothetical protein